MPGEGAGEPAPRDVTGVPGEGAGARDDWGRAPASLPHLDVTGRDVQQPGSRVRAGV